MCENTVNMNAYMHAGDVQYAQQDHSLRFQLTRLTFDLVSKLA